MNFRKAAMMNHSSIASASATVLLLLLLIAAGLQAAEQVAFNYPDPPREGKAGYFTIAQDGAARCVIVREGRSRLTAELLKTYLDLATGASIPLLDDGRKIPDGLAAIHVGDTAAARKLELNIPELHYGEDVIANLNGYLVQTVDPQTLVIRGVSETATKLGVVGFLKRYVGVRHYWAGNPGDLGDVVPPQKTLAVPELTWRDWPYFVSRTMSGLPGGGPPRDAASKVSSADFFRLNYTIPSNESYYRWLRADPHGKTHPEYFPLFEGKRFIPGLEQRGKITRVQQGWQPCVSNPELPKVIADQLIAYFDENPDAIAINLAVNDGNGDCQCAACAAMDAPGADLANRVGLCDRYVKFDNAVCELVAQKYPAKIIAFIAYGSMRLPPETVKLHPMLLPVLTMGGGVNAFANWDAWMKMGARRMGLYLYHDDQGFFIMPKVDLHQSAKRIRYAVASGTARHFYQEMYPFWPLDGMVPYLENELLWDPRQDVDAILEEYYTKFFGPAAAPMKAFYGTLEAGYTRWLEAEGLPHPFGKDRGSLSDGRSFAQYKVLNESEADAAARQLEQAAAAASSDARASERVDIVRRLFGFAALGARQYARMTELKSRKPASEADAQRIVTLARDLVALSHTQGRYKREIMEQPPANLYASFGTATSHPFYHNIDEQKVNPQVALVISDAMGSAAEALHTLWGPEKAAAWWQQQRQAEPDPLLGAALAIAERRSRGGPLENLVKDPSFEERGAGTWRVKGRLALPDFESLQGVYAWHRNGTPFHVSLADGEAHTGRYSVLLSECGKTVISESAASPGGGQYHLEVWLKHNEGAAAYEVMATPTGAEGKTAPTVLTVPVAPDAWQKVQFDLLAPDGTKAISLQVVANGQGPGARLWIDDFFIGRYAD
jgi:hypothetical protein